MNVGSLYYLPANTSGSFRASFIEIARLTRYSRHNVAVAECFSAHRPSHRPVWGAASESPTGGRLDPLQGGVIPIYYGEARCGETRALVLTSRPCCTALLIRLICRTFRNTAWPVCWFLGWPSRALSCAPLCPTWSRCLLPSYAKAQAVGRAGLRPRG